MYRIFSVLGLLAAMLPMGCGAPAAPAAPSLNLPNPSQNLAAARIGDSVHLAWTMTTRTTDRVVLKQPIPVQVCRAVDAGPCTPIASLAFAPGAAGRYSDALPADLSQGVARLLRYEVALRNHAGKSAGVSNAAYSAAGAGPAVLTGLTAQMRRDGVLLSWQVVEQPGPVLFRIERLQLSASTEAEKPRTLLAAPRPAAMQTLEVRAEDGQDPGHAIDASALFSQRYRYVVQRFVSRSLAGHTVEVQGPVSEPTEVATTDKFAPAVPQGLVSVADSAAGAIDLSWTPDGDSDLAAYCVYRRQTDGQNQPAQRIASVGVETSYRDTTAQPERTYAYSLSAVDQSGNESQPSAEVEETLPRR